MDGQPAPIDLLHRSAPIPAGILVAYLSIQIGTFVPAVPYWSRSVPHDVGHLLPQCFLCRSPGTNHKEQIMSKILVRVGGVAAVFAALLIIAQQIWTELVTGPHEN